MLLCFFLFHSTDSAGTGEMFRGNHLYWLFSVPDPWLALVPQFVVVLPDHFQLLLLRREPSGLLWSGR